MKDPKIGKAISETSLDFAKKAGKFGFGGAMISLAPGDFVIETAIRKLLPRLGLAAISAPALAAYTAYELALMAADVGKATAKAVQEGDSETWKTKWWEGFTEDTYSDKYSVGYKLTQEIHNQLFDEVYGRISTEMLPGNK